jgi:hypothetical protein
LAVFSGPGVARGSGEAFQEDAAVDQFIGVLHLFDRFLALLLGELGASALKHPQRGHGAGAAKDRPMTAR